MVPPRSLIRRKTWDSDTSFARLTGKSSPFGKISESCLDRAFQPFFVRLSPFSDDLSHNLSAGKLENFFDELNPSVDSFVLSDLLSEKVLRIPGGDFGTLLQYNVCWWHFFVMDSNSNHRSVGHMLVLEQHGLRFGRSDLKTLKYFNMVLEFADL